MNFGRSIANLANFDRYLLRSCYTQLLTFGKVAEWSNASDLKSDEVQASVSSNLTLSVLNLEPSSC